MSPLRLRPLAASLVVLTVVAIAVAAPRVGRRPGTRYIQAQRQAEIAQLQAQWNQARQTLDQILTTKNLSEGQLEEARRRAVSAREQVDQANDAEQDSNKQLRELETKILDDQSDDSELGKALTTVEAAQHELDREMHRILKWPDPDPNEPESQRIKEIGSLSLEQRTKLNDESTYVKKKDAVKEAAEAVQRARMKALNQNSEWQRLHTAHVSMMESRAKADHDRGEASSKSRDARDQAKSATQVAASLQQSLEQIEMRLRTLGSAPKPAKDGNTGKKR
jgi:DNA repair exonuclease SbcCD ATPase subunit